MIGLRVTSVWRQGKRNTVFAGVPVNKENRVKNVHQIIVVHTPTVKLPVKPAKGQCWDVSGRLQNQLVQKGGYHITETHVYADNLELVLPNDGENFIRFIAENPDFSGIGTVKARKLWETYNKDLYSIIQHQESEKLTPYLTSNSIFALYNGWTKYANLRYLNWFVQRNIPTNIVGRLLRHHGHDSVEAIQADPYRLLHFGLKWQDADELSQKFFGIETDDVRRLSAATEVTLLNQAEKGHTQASYDELFPKVSKLLCSNDLAVKALEIGSAGQRFVIDEEGAFHSVGMMVMERVVALRINKLSNNSEQWQDHHDQKFQQAASLLEFPLAEKQKEAAVQSLINGFSVITGGAGTGKTTVLQVIMNTSQQLGYKIFPMALSGRAAMRIKESTGFPSRTIAGFLKNEHLKAGDRNLVIIDEASMVDLPTMYRIVTHIPDTAKILLVGDVGQLQPIGPGLILHDVVRSNSLLVTELDVVKRQDKSSRIPEYTCKVRSGEVPNQLSYGQIHFHETEDENINGKILQLITSNTDRPQVIGASYRPSFGGIDVLNSQCQNVMNPDGKDFQFEYYGERRCLVMRVGDPIIFTENDWEADIQNGSLGTLIDVEQTDQDFGAVRLDTGRLVRIKEGMLNSIKLAYAISLHKAQGSQFPHILIPLTKSRMINRSWIYTALTRAERRIDIVGNASDFERSIRNTGNRRNTWLHRLLQ